MFRSLRYRGRAATLLLLWFAAVSAQATEYRTWTDDAGKHKVRAKLESVEDGKAVLIRENGSKLRIAVARLSQEDQQYVSQHAGESPFEDGDGKTQTHEEKGDASSKDNDVASLAQAVYNIRRIHRALLDHAAAYHSFPAYANFDKDGKPLLSWRVHLLQMIYEEQGLYRKFHLDEPWDSEHNRKLIPLMPKLFQSSNELGEAGKTQYLAVYGKGLAFDGNKGRMMRDFADGTAQSIMLVEVNADRAVTWTKPEDWQYDAEKPMAGLGAAHAGGFHVAFVAPTIRLVPSNFDPKVFSRLLTIAGNDIVPQDAMP